MYCMNVPCSCGECCIFIYTSCIKQSYIIKNRYFEIYMMKYYILSVTVEIAYVQLKKPYDKLWINFEMSRTWWYVHITLIARFMGPTWDPSGADRTQVGPMLAPWSLLSGYKPKIDRLLAPQMAVMLMYWTQNLSSLWRQMSKHLTVVGNQQPHCWLES